MIVEANIKVSNIIIMDVKFAVNIQYELYIHVHVCVNIHGDYMIHVIACRLH